MQKNVADFKIVSSALFLLSTAYQTYSNTINPVDFVKQLGLLATANLGMLYYYFQKVQSFELRANDDAAQLMGINNLLAKAKEELWLRDYSQNPTIKQRLRIYTEWLGFCTQGSLELQIRRLKELKKENAFKHHLQLIK